jgi:leucine dehydrogenase
MSVCALGGFERVEVERGRRSGALICVAIHSTTLGPALGGARMWHYGRERDAVADAMRLAEAMTMKAAAAGLDLGGGKGVIAAPDELHPEDGLRRALLLDFGDLVESLGGSYITAEDVGTGAADMEVIAERTRHVVGLDAAAGGSGDPSPVTALGVLASMRACVAHRWGTGRGLDGLEVSVIGVGHVGSELTRLLVDAGATVRATDLNPALRGRVAELGAEWVEPGDALDAGTDVLAPCALGGVVDEATAATLSCEILCGAANNVLTSDEAAERLAERGILYAPDFIANAGGLISVAAELQGGSHERALEMAAGIEGTMLAILERAEAEGVTPLAAAREGALERLGRSPERVHARLAG